MGEYMDKKNIGLIILILLMVLPKIASAVNTTCIDDNTLQVNTSYTGTGASDFTINISNEIYCPFGCSNNQCEGSSIQSSMGSIWMVYGTGTIMLVLAVILGLPFGKFAEKDDKEMKKPFNTTIVVKYLFFFIGLFLEVLALGMMKRASDVYGSETNITGGLNTAMMVIIITLGLFVFIFVLEFLFGIIKNMMETKKLEDWGEREIK
jgi:hypothetical protein